MYVTYRCEERETAEAVKDVDFVVRAHVNKLLDCLIARSQPITPVYSTDMGGPIIDVAGADN